MERLWKLSLMVLLSGIVFDVLATYFGMQAHGIDIEANAWAVRIVRDWGLEALFPYGLVVFIGGILPWMLIRMVLGRYFAETSTFLSFLCGGTARFLAGSTWLARTLLRGGELFVALFICTFLSTFMWYLSLVLPLLVLVTLLLFFRRETGGRIGGFVGQLCEGLRRP